MGSIGSTINSINSALLSEISRFNAKQSQSGTSSPAAATATDRVDFSQVAQLFKDLKQLETSNPAEFKQVAADAAAKLKAAAGQTTDTQQAAFLNSLADKFQTAASTGNLSALVQGSSPQGASGLYSAHGRHHHHHGGGATTAANPSPDQTQTPDVLGNTGNS
jgi:hypothetical protein